MTDVANDQLLAAIEDLRAQVADLRARLQRIEQPESPPPPPPVVHEELSPEILTVISAAVAAFLGERGHIRAVRLVGSARWAQEGRVSIQASHRLDRT